MLLAIWRLNSFHENLSAKPKKEVLGSTIGILLNFYAENPPQHKAVNDSDSVIKKSMHPLTKL